MEKIELQLDRQTLARAMQLAASRDCSVEMWIADVIKQLTATERTENPFLGMFADAPEVVDEVIESALVARETHPLRQTDG